MKMTAKSTVKISVVVPNWNGKDTLGACLDSLRSQTIKSRVIVIENGSTDDSLDFLKTNYPDVEIIENDKNLGFAGGVNVGIRKSMGRDDDFVALFNNDAVADKLWLENLVDGIQKDSGLGMVTCKLLSADKKILDSTGDYYTSWGLPYPRGRGEVDIDKYDGFQEIFAASGGASLYRVDLFAHIGLFDEDFFAYYEDVDISFRAQLAGWKVKYIPSAIAYHHISATSSKIKGFTTYQTMKNLPWLFWKNVPASYVMRIGIRFAFAYISFFFSAIGRGQGWPALKGLVVSLVLLPKKLSERRRVQKHRQVKNEYIWNMLVHDLPPNASKLRLLRAKWWKLTRRKT